MNDSELSNVADRLFQAFVDHDGNALRELCDPDARFWSSATGGEVSLDELVASLPAMQKAIGKHRYEDVRRMIAADGFVEEHAVRSTRPSGEALDVQACVVVHTDDALRVVRLDEYIAGSIRS
jgi:ketosteroid isomerase-like protein